MLFCICRLYIEGISGVFLKKIPETDARGEGNIEIDRETK